MSRLRLVIVGGSDAGISAAPRARELAPDTEVSVLLAADVASLDLSYTPSLGSPYDAVQHAAQAWTDAVTPGQSVASQAG